MRVSEPDDCAEDSTKPSVFQGKVGLKSSDYKHPGLDDHRTQDRVIDLLVAAGLTVRYFDPEEQQWMDTSKERGVYRVAGNRDGTWGRPDLASFEQDYLSVT